MTRVRLSLRISVLSLLPAASLIASSAANAQGAAFTFQGRLTDSANPADGLYDIRFKLFDFLATMR